MVDIQNLINEVKVLTQNNNTLTMEIQALAVARAGAGTVAQGISRCVEVFADLGEYNGLKVKFEKWWVKMKAWLTINSGMIASRSYEGVVAILSQLKGSKVDEFTQTRLI